MAIFLLLSSAFRAVSATGGLEGVLYKGIEEEDSAAKAFVSKEDKGTQASKFVCGAMCNLKGGDNFPLEHACNAFAWDPVTLACEIGTYDTDYVAAGGDDPVTGKELYARPGNVVDYLVTVGGRIGAAGAIQTSSYVQRDDGTLCTGHNIPALPQERTSVGMVVVGSRIYIAGGRHNAGVTGGVLMLDLRDPVPRSWQNMDSMRAAHEKPALVVYKDEKIYGLGAKDDTSIERYDIAGDRWYVVAGQTLPWAPAANFHALEVDETRAWINNNNAFVQFDMDTETIRNDISIPPATITQHRAVTIRLDSGKRVVLVMDPLTTMDTFTIDPDDLTAGWTKRGGLNHLPGVAGVNLAPMHNGRTAYFVIHGGLVTPEWMYYDLTTTKFAWMNGIPGMPANLAGTYTSTKGVAAVHFPECRGA